MQIFVLIEKSLGARAAMDLQIVPYLFLLGFGLTAPTFVSKEFVVIYPMFAT